jgi:hypothetical protein
LSAPAFVVDPGRRNIAVGISAEGGRITARFPPLTRCVRLILIANRCFAYLFSYLVNTRLTDTLCGTKVLLRKDYEVLARERAYFGNFDPFGDFDLIFGTAKQNLKIIETPIHYKARTFGETQISRFRDGWLLFKMVWFSYKLKARHRLTDQADVTAGIDCGVPSTASFGSRFLMAFIGFAALKPRASATSRRDQWPVCSTRPARRRSDGYSSHTRRVTASR